MNLSRVLVDVHMFALILSIGICVSSCNRPKMSNVKVEISVVSDGVLYTGYSVQSMGCSKPTSQFGSTSKCVVKGEAAFVEVSDKGYLVVPIAGEAFNYRSYMGGILDPRPLNAREWSLTDGELPLMVTFTDNFKPSTVIEVTKSNFSKLFPRSYLKDIRVSLVDEKVTDGNIEKPFPWALDKEARNMRGMLGRSDNLLESRLRTNHFKAGQ